MTQKLKLDLRLCEQDSEDVRPLFEETRLEGHFVIGRNNRGRGTEASEASEASKGRVQGRGLLGKSGEEVTGIS